MWPLLFRAFQNRVSWVRGETVDAGEDDNSLGFKITMIILPSLIAKKKKKTLLPLIMQSAHVISLKKIMLSLIKCTLQVIINHRGYIAQF